MKSTADVVVIGAGGIGCSAAYHLAQKGMKDVAVVEMDQDHWASSLCGWLYLELRLGWKGDHPGAHRWEVGR